ncbi:hypothetical protein F8M41_003889 [Gigaspora margarita]|uniref:Uncharacterized protein n=1 Tax=Gigaspora margarita TaxID=4874 RepID=A0A8H4ES21_GIGMA|nr:hypothetical protein F8M41_003889 [Gigaspora margarita]
MSTIVYTKYFSLLPSEIWSLPNFIIYAVCNNIYEGSKFKAHRASSYSFLNYLRYNINDHQQWNKRTAMFTRYCNGLKLCSEDPDISDELKQRWKELIVL